MKITTEHNLCYETTDDMLVSTVTKSLLANERMILEACSLLAHIYPSLDIQERVVKISRVQHQSPLKEIFSIALFVTYQDELTKEVPEMINNIFGYQVPENLDALVTVLVLMVAMQIISIGTERAFPGKSLNKLKADLEEKVGIAAKLTGASKEEILAATESKFSDAKNNALLKKAYDFFFPAKLNDGCAITTTHGFTISREAIKEIPNEIELLELDEIRTYELRNANLEIHRTDRDYNKQGWRAELKDISDKPLKMELAQSLVPSELYGAIQIVGDVIVVEEKQSNGIYLPKSLHLISVLSVRNS